MSKKKFFEYVVIHHKEVKQENNVVDYASVVLIEKTSALAKDEKSLGMLIARKLPEAVLDDLDNVEILIKPF